jgi:hypothetical protein
VTRREGGVAILKDDVNNIKLLIHCCPGVPEEYETPHQFKESEWNCAEEELIAAFVVFYSNVIVPARTTPFRDEVWVNKWWPCVWSDEIRYFLHCLIAIARGLVQSHHVRCVVSLLREGKVRLPEPERRSA